MMCVPRGKSVNIAVVVVVVAAAMVQADTPHASHPDIDTDVLSRYPGQDDYISPTVPVMAGVGSQIDLPCNLTSPLPNDPVLLVLWYKSGIHEPVYSYDARGNRPSHFVSWSVLGPRATFYPSSSTLTLQDVQMEDQGTYRCRVDFKTNPTLTFTTKLTVIVPPHRLAVYTEQGVVAHSVVGPFTEGETLRLTCRATGGLPPPSVIWLEGEVYLDMVSEVRTLNLVANKLEVPALTRKDLHRTLTCRASNSNMTAPLVTSVTLDMTYAPLWVRLLSSRDPLSAGKAYQVVCQAAGARPSANITWRLGPTILPSHIVTMTHEGNMTTSELQFTPNVTDAGKILSCEATPPSNSMQPLVDDWLLDIYYVPRATLDPGRTLNLSNIEEGDDVYFECSIKANPWVYKIIWLHEDRELQHNVSAGIIISNQSLVLQKIARTASGNYYCVATNIEGDGQSNPIHLKVKYAPVCRDPEMTYHGAARLEQVNIPCHLDANPLPLTYRWTFNNSGESVEIPQEHIQMTSYSSTVSYTPKTELDYGTLLCWGTNIVGQQRRPCVFHVFPAGRPDSVHNCSSFNLSASVVHVRCMAGFDGGLPQTFILELRDPHSNTLIANNTNMIPLFSVPGLPSGLTLNGVIFSTNAKGQSETVKLQVYTIKDVAEKRTGGGPPKDAKYTELESAVIALIPPSGYAGLPIPESGGFALNVAGPIEDASSLITQSTMKEPQPSTSAAATEEEFVPLVMVVDGKEHRIPITPEGSSEPIPEVRFSTVSPVVTSRPQKVRVPADQYLLQGLTRILRSWSLKFLMYIKRFGIECQT